MEKEFNRFETAVVKLYNAFHSGELLASDCSACAVGNICDNSSFWSGFFGHRIRRSDIFGGNILEINSYEQLLYKIKFRQNGYSGYELHEVERIFLEQFIGTTEKDKEAQFRGLCAVVEYLCELDGIENVMDYTKLFETDGNKPKYELEIT